MQGKVIMQRKLSASNGHSKSKAIGRSSNLDTLVLMQEGAEDLGEDLLYFAGPFTVRVRPEGKKCRITVLRGKDVLGLHTLTLSDQHGRRQLLSGLKGVNPKEATILEKALLQVASRFEEDLKQREPLAEERRRQLRQKQAEQAAADAEEEQCRWLRKYERSVKRVLANPALLFKVGETLGRRGLVGERANGLLLYLALVSQITEEPICAVVKGDSSGGKSHLVKKALELVPDWAHIDLTSMSQKGLIYDRRPFAHRTIIFFEVHGEGDEYTSYLIRTLISEGEIRHLAPQGTPDGLVSCETVKAGPTNVITTTTLPELNGENETRLFTVLVDDSPAMTREVLAHQAAVARGDHQPVAVDNLRAAFTWLHVATAKKAVIPFADLLSDAIPNKPLRVRRDFPRLINLIKACALLHQQQRERDDQGRVIATLADYAMVRELVLPVFLRALKGITEKTLELVRALKRVLADKAKRSLWPTANYADLKEVTGRDKPYISRWLGPALELGLVEDVHHGERGKAAALKLGSVGAQDGGVLPTVKHLARKLGVDVAWVSPVTGAKESVNCCNRTATP
jgi:hypothetical protein